MNEVDLTGCCCFFSMNFEHAVFPTIFVFQIINRYTKEISNQTGEYCVFGERITTSDAVIFEELHH